MPFLGVDEAEVLVATLAFEAELAEPDDDLTGPAPTRALPQGLRALELVIGGSVAVAAMEAFGLPEAQALGFAAAVSRLEQRRTVGADDETYLHGMAKAAELLVSIAEDRGRQDA